MKTQFITITSKQRKQVSKVKDKDTLLSNLSEFELRTEKFKQDIKDNINDCSCRHCIFHFKKNIEFYKDDKRYYTYLKEVQKMIKENENIKDIRDLISKNSDGYDKWYEFYNSVNDNNPLMHKEKYDINLRNMKNLFKQKTKEQVFIIKNKSTKEKDIINISEYEDTITYTLSEQLTDKRNPFCSKEKITCFIDEETRKKLIDFK